MTTTNRLLREPIAMRSLCSQYPTIRELEGRPPTVPSLAVFLGFSTSRHMLNAAQNDPPDQKTDRDALHTLRQAITGLEDDLLSLSLTGVYNASIGKHALSAYHKVNESTTTENTDRALEIHWIKPPQDQIAVNNNFLIANSPPDPLRKDRSHNLDQQTVAFLKPQEPKPLRLPNKYPEPEPKQESKTDLSDLL